MKYMLTYLDESTQLTITTSSIAIQMDFNPKKKKIVILMKFHANDNQQWKKKAEGTGQPLVAKKKKFT